MVRGWVCRSVDMKWSFSDLSEQNMVNKQLVKSALSAVYGAAVLGSVGVISGSINLGSIFTGEIGTQAPLVAVVALIVAAVIHGPSFDMMQKWQILVASASVGIPVVLYLGQPAAVVSMIGTGANNHPWTSLGAAGITYAGAWFVTWK